VVSEQIQSIKNKQKVAGLELVCKSKINQLKLNVNSNYKTEADAQHGKETQPVFSATPDCQQNDESDATC